MKFSRAYGWVGTGAAIFLHGTVLLVGPLHAETSAPSPWTADLGNGSYQNPVLFSDYSDPDVVRVGEDYYLTASSFGHLPGLPVLHSKDLVNWKIIAYGVKKLAPEDFYSVPRPSGGVWAPAIRHREGKFYIFYPDPDFGLFLITATDPAGPWSEPVLIRAGKGLIDPCPLWDEDGSAYLIHGWAKSRSGKNNILSLYRMSPDGTRLLDDGEVIIDGNKIPGMRTLEGPKFYKRDGWYYVFAPVGGVVEGSQAVFRSKNIHGPYEQRITLEQGNTEINGPHQGAWVDTISGEDWFLHFQSRNAYGRIVHLQPMVWKDGWPVMGEDADGDGTGNPVMRHRKPDTPVQAVGSPQMSDEFEKPELGLCWQWQANPSAAWSSLTAHPGSLRLIGTPTPENLYHAPNLLTQKLPAPDFSATTEMEFSPMADGDAAGLVMTGANYAWMGLKKTSSGIRLILMQRLKAEAETESRETELAGLDLPANATLPIRITLRVNVRSAPSANRLAQNACCTFLYSMDGKTFTALNPRQEFQAERGRWEGSNLGLFSSSASPSGHGSFADFTWFRITPPVMDR